jgi:CubicO group peptidase (beta-lactamase class C family)/Tol biopolymer transport system component
MRFGSFLAWALLAATAAPAQPIGRTIVTSHITILNADGSGRKILLSAPRHFEAPNWSRDGSYLLLNSEGKLWRLPIEGGDPRLVPTGDVDRINNDHGISPDGSTLAISAGPIYLLPAAGGTPRRITEKTPSYFHGWSPDGRTLAYCAPRANNFDLYSISVTGGAETRLTTHAGYDDGPDYSPDGQWIYFNSDRSGSWDLWRIPAEGAVMDDAKAERITDDDLEDWFPHPSPDGRQLVFVSFANGTKGHPANQDVVLRTLPLPGTGERPKELIKLFGGQGTINVNSWSPDSRRFAYVSYSRPEDGPALPTPWSARDIGDVTTAGGAGLRDGSFTLTGTLDIWGKADGCHFAYQTLEGDGQVVARVTAVENTNEHAKAGVMFRDALTADARHAAMVVTPVDGTQFLRRKEPAGMTTNTNPERNRGVLPCWVKLVRAGDRFTAYESTDGQDWVLAGSDTVSLGKRAYVGLVASSHQKAVTNTASLDHVTVTPAPAVDVTAALQPFVDRGELAGAVALVANQEKVLDLRSVGFADLTAHKPMTDDALFWIASQSKPITATALMMLVDEGKVKLDDAVEHYLPEFRGQWVATQRSGDEVVLRKPRHPITVREILSHTSGLPFRSTMEEPTLDLLPLRVGVKSYAMTPLDFEPGTKYAYSNAGINTAGRIIEVVSGMSYEDFLDKHLFNPLGMTDTTFWPSAAQLARLAKAYKPGPNQKGLEEIPITQLRYPLNDRTRQSMPAGGLFSTARDLARFCRMVLNRGTLDGRRYLTESAVSDMTRKQTAEPIREGYGLGWSTGGDSFGHGGAYATNMTIDSRRPLITIFLVQHAGFPGDGGKAHEAFRKAAADFAQQ